MVDIPYEERRRRNVPKEMTQQLRDIAKKAQAIKGIYALILINPLEPVKHQLLCVVEDENEQAAKESLALGEQAKTIFWSHFWIHLNDKNAVVTEYLRKGAVLYDQGYVSPLQELLFQGKLRPSKEATWNEMLASQQAMKRAEYHIKQAVVDLYWCMVDCAHALLAALGEVAPSPRDMEKMLNEKVVPRKLLRKEQVDDFAQVFAIAKKVDHGEVFTMTGKEYDELEEKAQQFLTDVKELVKEVSRLP